MNFPNLLGTRRGRLTTFFVLYITEGAPLGFAAARWQGWAVQRVGYP